MVLLRFYTKKIKHVVCVLGLVALVGFSVTFVLHDTITQVHLEAHALQLHRQSHFNPRDSTHALFEYIHGHLGGSPSTMGDKNGIYFHWDDWVDLSAGDSILHKYRTRSPDGTCDKAIESFADVNGYFMESYQKKVLRGMADLYCLKETPKKIVVATDDNYIEVPVVGRKRLGLSGNYSKEAVVQKMAGMLLDETDLKTTNYKALQKQVQVPPEDFIFSPDLEIFRLKQKLNTNDITASEIKRLDFLQYANKIVDSADRFFKYPWIITDVVSGRSHHLAYPFFKKFISDRERQSVIHHMVRAWFQFAEANGFASWINYGSLLGWAYNGVNMPWDTDIDIQLPIAQIDRLGQEFNRTLVMENPRFGNAKYMLEVAPTYIRQGNGRNFIDARFIDINSGLYIDISALSHSTSIPPPEFYEQFNSKDEVAKAMPVHCKNWNWHTLDELLPIRHTYFEGASVYIPHNISSILDRKYGHASYTTKLHFLSHNYQKDIQMWVPDRICERPPNVPSRFVDELHSQLTVDGACNDMTTKDEYRINHEPARKHAELNIDVDTSVDYDPATLGDLPIFRKDSWDYYNDIANGRAINDNWYIRQDV